jgi:hypothetical protein
LVSAKTRRPSIFRFKVRDQRARAYSISIDDHENVLLARNSGVTNSLLLVDNMETLTPAQSIYEIDVKESLVIGVREVTAVNIERNLTNLMKDGNTHGIVDEIVEYDVELEDHAIEDVSRPPLILRRTTKGSKQQRP